MRLVKLIITVSEHAKNISTHPFLIAAETEKHFILEGTSTTLLLLKKDLGKMEYQNTSGIGFSVMGFIKEGEANLATAILHIKKVIREKIKEIINSRDLMEIQLDNPDIISRH